MKRERVELRVTVFFDDGDGAYDLDARWRHFQDALYHFRGVELVEELSREDASPKAGEV